MTMLYPLICSSKVCYKGTTLNLYFTCMYMLYAYQIFWHIFLRDEISCCPMRINQVPLSIDMNGIPAVVVLGALELVSGSVV